MFFECQQLLSHTVIFQPQGKKKKITGTQGRRMRRLRNNTNVSTGKNLFTEIAVWQGVLSWCSIHLFLTFGFTYMIWFRFPFKNILERKHTRKLCGKNSYEQLNESREFNLVLKVYHVFPCYISKFHARSVIRLKATLPASLFHLHTM